MITKPQILNFLNQYDYDIRKTNNGRWLDQKVTFDVSSMIADCVMHFCEDDIDKEFTTKDIWHSEYAAENILTIFNKPDVNEKKMANEYDKFFGQPLLFLASSNILKLRKDRNKNYFKINNIELLNFVASRDFNAFIFTYLYIEKVMKDSGLWPLFDDFFIKQDKKSFYALKDGFMAFLKSHTKISKDYEPKRIFTKVLNPLSVDRKKLGTKGGNISKSIISLSDLRYNQSNFRDVHSKKPKEVSRQEWILQLEQTTNSKRTSYQVNKSKQYLHKFNNDYRAKKSELNDEWGNGEATQMHHIFPASDYPELSDYLENLIALTPTQHYTKAHPNNNTQRIDSNYQKELLMAKLKNIISNLSSDNEPTIYDLSNFVKVLEVGFDIEIKDEISYDSLEKIILNN